MASTRTTSPTWASSPTWPIRIRATPTRRRRRPSRNRTRGTPGSRGPPTAPGSDRRAQVDLPGTTGIAQVIEPGGRQGNAMHSAILGKRPLALLVLAVAAAAAVLAATLNGGSAPKQATAASHREAPLIS